MPCRRHRIWWLCFTSHQQRGKLETEPPIYCPLRRTWSRFLHRSHRESNCGLSRGSPLHYRRAKPALHTGYDTPPRHSIQTQGRPVVLSFDVERHKWKRHTTQCYVFGQTRSGNTSPDLPHAPTNAQLYDAVMVVFHQKPGRNCTVHTDSWIRDLWCANPLRYPLTHSYFLEDK